MPTRHHVFTLLEILWLKHPRRGLFQNIEPRTEVRRFADSLLQRKFVIEANLKRRHLTDFQKAELGIALEDIESQMAARNQEETIPSKGEKAFQPVLEPNDANTDPETGEIDYCKTKTYAKVAKKVGLSTKTYEHAKQIIEKAPEELKEKILAH